MFDIVAGVDVTVTGFDCNMGDVVNPYNMEIYYKAGTHVGFTANPGAWTLIGTANNVMGLGTDLPTPIPIALNVTISAGQTGAFYITDTGGPANIDYTNGVAVGALMVNDGNISILEGTGKDYAFGADYVPRAPNITVYYDCCPLPLLVPTDNSCSGMPDGSLEATGQGTGPWVYELGDDLGNSLFTTPPVNGPFTFTGLVDGTYTVYATDATSCTSSEDTVLVAIAELTIDTVVTDNLCFGGTLGEAAVTITGGTAPYDILWADALGNPIQIDPATNGMAAIAALPSGVYIVGGQDANGCIIAGPFDISEPAVPLTVTLTPQDLSCFQSADGEIEANQDGVAPFSYELFNAQGALVASGNASNPYTFTGLDAISYTVIVTDNNGCEASDVIALNEPTEIQLTTTQTPVLCNNGSEGTASIVLVTGGSAPYNTSWNDPAGQIGNTATQLAAGSYTATVTDANGCTETADFMLTNPPALFINGSYITDTCGQGLGAAVAQVSLGTPPYTYNWGPNGDDAAVYDSLSAGSYGVLVTDANGCMATAVVNVSDDLPYPFADIEYWIEGESVMDQAVQFLNNSVGTSTYTWRFGDGESTYDTDPRHVYDREGDYLVQLVASNGFCEDTAYQYVNIDPLLRLYAPNSFTPGIDGKNDTFAPVGEGIEEESYDMFIYNRWGELIWQTSNYNKKWNGTDMRSLKPVPVGTYVWMVKFREYADLDRHVYKGWVNVIRE